jgi:hypothetical protein
VSPDDAIHELKEHFERCMWVPHGLEIGNRGMACVLVLEQMLHVLRQELRAEREGND